MKLTWSRVFLTSLLAFAFSGNPVAHNDSPIDSGLVHGSNGEVRRWEVTGPWGGDVRSLVVSPHDPNLFYLGTSDGQIFRSTDGARTWRRLKPGLESRGLSVDNIIIDPRDPRRMFAGAWAVSPGTDAQGVFRSTDGGESWTLLEQTTGLNVNALALAPSDSNLLVAGAKNGVFRTRDGGRNWERLTPEGHRELRNLNSAAIHPINTDIIYIGTNHLPWRSTDGGATWHQTGYKATGMIDDTDIMGICINPSNPKQVLMNGCSGIYRSMNGGDKWTKLPGIPFSARRTYALLQHPTRPQIMFAGTSEGLWRSKDGGRRWALLTSKTLVIRAIALHPDDPDRVVIGTDDHGVLISNNLGDNLTETNVGFIHRHILAIAPDNVEAGRILISVYHDAPSGSVFLSLDGGETWAPSSIGLGNRDVFAFHQSPDDPNVIYAGTNAGVYKSTDRGARWSFLGIDRPAPARRPARRRRADLAPQNLLGPGTAGKYQTVAAQRRRAPARKRPAPKRTTPKPPAKPAGPTLTELTLQVDDITTFTDLQNRRGLIAATVDGLYRTFDERKGWEKIIVDQSDPAARVYSLTAHKDAPNRVFAGTRRGLYVSGDGGETWQGVQRGPSDMSIKSLAIDPRDADLVLVGTNQFVFRTTNGGRSWLRRGGGIPSGDYTAVAINPARPDEVLAADYSQGGIYRSLDRGYSWERIDAELPTSRVWTLSFDPFDENRVYAGSFSSGVYVLTFQYRTRVAK